jgi:hypothetical protein
MNNLWIYGRIFKLIRQYKYIQPDIHFANNLKDHHKCMLHILYQFIMQWLLMYNFQFIAEKRFTSNKTNVE